MAGTVAAFSFNDLINMILGLFGMGGDQDTVACNPPYIKVGGECCLDRNGNRVCDRDEAQPGAPTTTQQKPATPTTTVGGAAAPTTTQRGGKAKPTTTTLKTNLRYKTVTLTGVLVADVDPVLTKNKNLLLQPTREAGKGSFLDVVDMSSMSHTGSVLLSGDLVSGLDVVALSDSKTALMPTKKTPLQGVLDIIDVTTRSRLRTLDMAGAPQVDVDVQVTPDESIVVMLSRQDASNSFLEIVDLSTKTVTKKI